MAGADTTATIYISLSPFYLNSRRPLGTVSSFGLASQSGAQCTSVSGTWSKRQEKAMVVEESARAFAVLFVLP